MKEYTKQYEDIYTSIEGDPRTEGITSTFGSSKELAVKFRDFYYDAHRQIFNNVVKHVWLEQQFVFKGTRRQRRYGNGQKVDWAFGYFMHSEVGISQKPVTMNYCFTAIVSYLPQLFPSFLDHDPFAEPEYYAYPFKHVTLDHMFFVYQMEERMEMLKVAEERHMKFSTFANWAVNQAFCVNDELGDIKYALGSSGYMWPRIKNVKLRKFVSNYKFI